MNRWFVIHDLLAFEQHPDMISNVVKKTGIEKPRFFMFGQIQKGDLIVYYATKDMIAVGVFRVISDIRYIPQDPYWGEVMVFKIEPFKLPPKREYLDFKKLVTSPDIYFDLFPEKKHWGSYLQGQTCKLLSEEDYCTIKEAISQEKYMKNKEQIRITATTWHDKYGKALEQLIVSLTDTEKRILRAIMRNEEGHRLISEKELVSFLTYQDTRLFDDSLTKLMGKGLLKFMGRKWGQRRFSLTKRGRSIGVLVFQLQATCSQNPS